jgi:hypothetical protein
MSQIVTEHYMSRKKVAKLHAFTVRLSHFSL